MTREELLSALRSANAAQNVGVFRHRVGALLPRIPQQLLIDADIKVELRAIYRRLKREAPDDEPQCVCGHEFGWHDAGRHCLKCSLCPVFNLRPTDDSPKAAVRGSARSDQSRRWWEWWLSLPDYTQRELLDSGVVVQRWRKVPRLPDVNPWERRIAERAVKRENDARLMREANVHRATPGVSQHIANRESADARRRRREENEDALRQALRSDDDADRSSIGRRGAPLQRKPHRAKLDQR